VSKDTLIDLGQHTPPANIYRRAIEGQRRDVLALCAVLGFELNLEVRRQSLVGTAILLAVGLRRGASVGVCARQVALDLLLDGADEPDRLEQVETRGGRRPFGFDLLLRSESRARADSSDAVACSRLRSSATRSLDSRRPPFVPRLRSSFIAFPRSPVRRSLARSERALLLVDAVESLSAP
jgi:hypothetical protein